MELYYCKSEKGIHPPKYTHTDLSLAVAEAKRLSETYGCNVEILKIIGKVEWKEIPVVTTHKAVLTLEDGYRNNGVDDDLPF